MRNVAALLIAGAAGVILTAQPPARVATSADALLASAGFFHGRTVVLEQKLLTEGDHTRLADTPKPIYVFWKERPRSDQGEVRGEFYDLGRIEPRDGRFAGYDLVHLVDAVNRGQWPGRDQIFVLVAASLAPSVPPRGPTIRAIALAPDNYVDREVKVIGRFRGHNLYGDLPFPLGKGKWDFVLQSADGALWVTGVRPRGKGFDLDPSKRVDTGRWVELTGVVRRHGVTTYLDASAIALADPPEETAVEIALPEAPAEPPPTVIFSAPIQDDEQVDRTARVRIQFSRDMQPQSLKDQIRVAYVTSGAAGASPPAPQFTATYREAAHAVEIQFAEPLEPFQQVKVELLEGILALDGQPLKPWTLTFTTGR